MTPQGTIADWAFDPLEALRRWPIDRPVLLLHSGRFHQRWSRRSIMTQPVGTYRFDALTIGLNSASPPGDQRPRSNPTGQSTWLGPIDRCPVRRFTHNPFEDLRALLKHGDGLWVGYLSYDLGRWVEPRLWQQTHRDTGIGQHRVWPIIELAYCPRYLLHDAIDGKWRTSHAQVTSDSAPLPDLGTLPPLDHVFTSCQTKRGWSQAQYEAAAKRVKCHIEHGDIFQANLAHQLTIPWRNPSYCSGRTLYQHLAARCPAWYGAYLELSADSPDLLPSDDPSRLTPTRALASSSPELFLHVQGRRVITRPIKGTRPASVDPGQLYASDKDAAELNMIVDVLRNDLGRVCDYGSVRVSERRQVESHPTVHHGVATVTGDLHRSKDVVDLLRATFPGGSVTGAPKIRAMQIIDELESTQRGPYCGCIGYLSRDETCLSVAIRTLLLDPTPGGVERTRVNGKSGGSEDSGSSGDGVIDLSVGSGIVADSDPTAEYFETLDKAAAMLAALGGCIKSIPSFTSDCRHS